VSQICFIITDREHKIYYAPAEAEGIFNRPVSNIRNTVWFSHLSTEPELAQTLVLHDLKKQGFFNGFVSFSEQSALYFCDYGKRYDVNGQHIGYEMVLTSTSQDPADYARNFYQGILEQVKQSGSTPEQVYEKEKASIEQNVGTEFNEFLLAILEEHED